MELDSNTEYYYYLQRAKELTGEDKLVWAVRLKALQIADLFDDGLYLVNMDGIITDVNNKYCRLTGVKREDCIGRPVQDIAERYFITKSAASLQALSKNERVSVITRAKNTGKDFLVTACPMKADDGSVFEIVTVLRDITMLKQLEVKLHESIKVSEQYKKELNYFRNINAENTKIIGESVAIKNVLNLVNVVSQSDATVLITGETGTGKELLATEIYRNSKRKDGPYVRVNCAAISESLLESELFGYERGAFTGAVKGGKAGLFEVADQGTLLLDEIGELPLSLQPKLLRVLQEGEVLRVGGTNPRKTDVRILATTNRNLLEEMDAGRFRKDLYYRLQVIPVLVPPLRERENDSVLLIDHFLKKFNLKYKKEKRIPTQAYNILKAYQWPGNVRELANIVERLVVVTPGDTISTDNVRAVLDVPMPENQLFENAEASLKDLVNDYERNILEQVLKESGSTHKAAKVLGISQPSVVRKAKAFGIVVSPKTN